MILLLILWAGFAARKDHDQEQEGEVVGCNGREATARLSNRGSLGYVADVKLLLIDGHYYVYRSFFAIQNLSNSRGEPTNAIFGFTKTLRLMVKDLQPELGAVFWDEGLPEKRMILQPAYKETRKEMPQPMVPQLDYIQSELTALLGFKNISLPNTEADDLMGCYAIAACKRDIEVSWRRTTRTSTSWSGRA